MLFLCTQKQNKDYMNIDQMYFIEGSESREESKESSQLKNPDEESNQMAKSKSVSRKLVFAPEEWPGGFGLLS